MKHTTFKIQNTNPFRNTNKSTNYSKILDNIISASLINTNSYLAECIKPTPTSKIGKIKTWYVTPAKKTYSSLFMNAVNFIANHHKTNTSTIIYGKKYKLSNGKTIIFYDDEIQIGTDVYSYVKFGDKYFLKSITPELKKTIIDIYTDSAINIHININ